MLSQSFGSEEAIAESDTLTAVQFDHTGEYLATGDHGGRIVLFSREADTNEAKGRLCNNKKVRHKDFKPF